jgi:hypothetical protein
MEVLSHTLNEKIVNGSINIYIKYQIGYLLSGTRFISDFMRLQLYL